jgi:hypothetical protein
MLKSARIAAFGLTALGLSALPAAAAPLTVVNVSAPQINCVFNPTCTITVTDSIGNFTPPGDSGVARLQSRSFSSTATSPAHGAGGYEYRVDLTGVKGLTAVNCVTRLEVEFGPVLPLPYSPKGTFDVYVVTAGGLGSVGVASAKQIGNNVNIQFTGSGVCPGQTSYFIGISSKLTMPKPGKAALSYSLGGGTTVDDRVPGP